MAIEKMGDKMTARQTMRAAGVPVIPGEEVEEADEQLALEALRHAAERVGYPLLLKASSGGGGKGMRAVHDPAEFDGAAAGARREAVAAFGDGRIYIERLLSGSSTLKSRCLPTSTVEPSTWVNVNAAFSDGTRKCSKKHPVPR